MISISQYISFFIFFYLLCVIAIFDVLDKNKNSDTILHQVRSITLDQQIVLTSPKRQTLSIPLGVVRLGNHLFKYASGYGIAKDRNSDFCVEQPPFRFQIFTGPFVGTCKSQPDKTIVEKKFGFCDNRFYKAYEEYSHIGIRRYFQCHNYFDKYKEDIRKIYEIKTIYYIKAKLYLESLIGKDNDAMLTCFHYRLGDMEVNNEGMTLPTKEYYLKVVNRVLNPKKEHYYKKHQFLIISDEPAKAYESLLYLEAFADTTVSHANLETDFIMMAKFCDNIVFSRGTFAWWAAYLNKNVNAVYYRDEFANNYMTLDVNRNTYYLKQWINIK